MKETGSIETRWKDHCACKLKTTAQNGEVIIRNKAINPGNTMIILQKEFSLAGVHLDSSTTR